MPDTWFFGLYAYWRPELFDVSLPFASYRSVKLTPVEIDGAR